MKAGHARTSRSSARELVAIETIARSIHAQHLQTNLDEATWVRPGETAREAAARLRILDFDQAPVGPPGRLLGYVVTSELEHTHVGNAAAAIHAIDAEHVVSASAGVLEVLEALYGGGPLAFVVDGRAITGFVAVSDINKQPARTHFYLLLTNLEAALADWVRTAFPDVEDAVALLGDDAKKVRGRFRRDQKNNVAVDLVTGMDLGHLLAIAGLSEVGQRRFSAESFGGWDAWVVTLTSLRNAVMHPMLTFLGPQRTLADLLAIDKGLREVLARASHEPVGD
jgi:hypothetical protein